MKKISLLLVVLLIAFAGCKKSTSDQNAIDNKIILAYIQANNLTATATGSGLYYVVTTQGDATRPISTSTVYVKYRGYLLDGTKRGIQFDSSFEAGDQASQFPMAQLTAGFREGLKLFGKGGKGQLIIPSSLGYGGNAAGVIPANSVLIFDIELVSFQ